MQKKNSIIIAVLVVVVLGIGAFALMHKSSSPSGSAYSTTNTTSTNSTSSNTKDTAATINNAVVVTKTNSTVGEYLTTSSGQALYTYGADTTGVSNCTASCLASWPAYQDTGSTSSLPANFGTIKRSDNGQTQYTYKGMPLYTFTADSAGQMTGNGVSDFAVAQP